jgi:hypothetical protein
MKQNNIFELKDRAGISDSLTERTCSAGILRVSQVRSTGTWVPAGAMHRMPS